MVDKKKQTTAARRKAENKCTRCGEPLPLNSKNTVCGRCLKLARLKYRLLHEERIKQGLCPMCGKREPFGNFKICEFCLEKQTLRKEKQRDWQKEYDKKRYEKHRIENVCVGCGRPAMPGHCKCSKCAEKERIYHRNKYKLYGPYKKRKTNDEELHELRHQLGIKLSEWRKKHSTEFNNKTFRLSIDNLWKIKKAKNDRKS